MARSLMKNEGMNEVNNRFSEALSSAPPLGTTMQVVETPAGTEVTLRPQGMARWGVVGFLAFWLCGWAAGEVSALQSLARGLGRVSSVEEVFGALFLSGFMLFW